MNTIMKLCLALLVTAALLTSCDRSEKSPNDVVGDNFKKMYPDAKHVEWEREDGYYVAEFRYNGNELEAWFDNLSNGWLMTKTEYGRNVPDVVKSAVDRTDYKNWRIDDVDFIEIKDRESFYIVEVEQGETEIDLYFSVNGTLIKEVADDGDYRREIFNQYNNSTTENNVKNVFNSMFPNATNVEWEIEKGYHVVEFRDNGYEKEAWFKSDASWVLSKTEYERNVPDAVRNTVYATSYKDWRIDDIDFIEMKDNCPFYIVEVEIGESEVDLYISENGELIKEITDDGDYHREIFKLY